MNRLYSGLMWAFLAALFSQDAALAAVVQITVKDQGGTSRNFNVTTNTDLTGNLVWNNTICDQAAGTTCASVGTAGSPSTNALTVQPVTLGNGTSANAPRVTLSNDGTGVLATVSTVTTLSTLTGGGVASGAADSGNPLKVGCKYNSSPVTLTDGNRGDCQADVNGYVKVNVTNTTTSLANNADGVAVQTGAANSPVNNYAYVWNGTTWDRQAGTTAGTKITAASGAVASGAIASGAIASGAVASGAYASGSIASGAYASGSLASGAVVDITNMSATVAGTAPTKAIYSGCRGQNAEGTAVTNGQITPVACDLVNKTIIMPYANTENFVSGGTAAMTGTTSTSVIASAGGSLRNYITACTFGNSHATVGTMILLQDGSGGTTLWEAPAASVFGGAHVVFPTPLKTTAATALFTANVTTGANTFVFCTGYKGI